MFKNYFMLFGHGDNAYQFNYSIKSNFSSNVYYKGTNAKLISFLKERVFLIEKYPEVVAESLSKILAQKYNLSSKNILVTNGATEAFYLIASLQLNALSEIFIPSFAEYEDACTQFNHTTIFTKNTLLKSTYKTKASYLWICNPNNPDGKVIQKETLSTLIKNNSKATIVLDESYKDFILEKESLVQNISQHKNLILVHSLTKKYAIPGLRLGYVIASEEIIAKLKQKKQPWSVNSLAIEAGNFLLENNIPFSIKKALILSKKLQENLSKIKGVTVVPSDTSYFLIQTNKKAHEAVAYLVKEHGILLRNASNFRGLNNYYLRISAQSKTENDKLVKALSKWMNI